MTEADSLREISMPESAEGMRFDSALALELGISRSAVEDIFESGDCIWAVDGEEVKKSDRVKVGDKIRVLLRSKESHSVESAPLPVIFEDSDIVVVAKAIGYAAHPSPGWSGPTVIGALKESGVQIAHVGSEEREGIVHRLDVGTSGLMVVAKSERAYSSLKDQFRSREVKKIYHALAQGHLDPAVGTIDAPIDRHPKEDHRFAVVASGKPSVTHYEAIEFFPAVTLARIELETGRTHQIRVHFNAIKHPLVGDLVYGADPRLAERLAMKRPWLHAMELEFRHPITGERVHFSAPYPPDLEESLASLRRSIGG
ncbi:MAG: RluA family pseudouridine synthase [Candidatus Nanopelagicaceae bacterium]